MRESIGGAWLFGIVIVFIALFSAFLTYSVSYTKAFNTKNEIINIIEENEGFTMHTDTSVDIKNAIDSELEKSTEGKIFRYMKDIGYNYSADIKCETENGEIEMSGQGYCISKICPNFGRVDGTTSNTHYKVTTFIALEIPFIGVTVRIPISGETRTIYHDETMAINCTQDIYTGGGNP